MRASTFIRAIAGLLLIVGVATEAMADRGGGGHGGGRGAGRGAWGAHGSQPPGPWARPWRPGTGPGWRPGVGVGIGIGVGLGGVWGWPYMYPDYYGYYGYPGFFPYPGYGYTWGDAPVTTPSLPVFVAPPPDSTAPTPVLPAQAASYWYYCPDSKAYYPQVQQCAQPWLTVLPSTPTPNPAPQELSEPPPVPTSPGTAPQTSPSAAPPTAPGAAAQPAPGTAPAQ